VDPHPDRLWPAAVAAADTAAPAGASPTERLAGAFLDHGRALIDAVAPACVGAKFQLACFERLGAAGWSALAALVAHARDAGLVVIADGKRGDISISALAYAQALIGATPSPFGPIAGVEADALTVNPLTGSDGMSPFVDTARERGRGLFVLVRTSNPGAADIQELELAGGGRVWERLANLVTRLGAGDVGDCGLSSVGAVVAATAPGHLSRLR
jgi:orotidine-5'-phosphate decarboxylase